MRNDPNVSLHLKSIKSPPSLQTFGNNGIMSKGDIEYEPPIVNVRPRPTFIKIQARGSKS